MVIHQQLDTFERAITNATSRTLTLPKRTLRLALYAELLALDMVALIAGQLIASQALSALDFPASDFYASAAVSIIYLVRALTKDAYSIQAISSPLASIRSSTTSFITAVLITLMVAFFLKSGTDISRLNFGMSSIITVALLILGRTYLPRHAQRVCGGSLVNELLILHGKTASASKTGPKTGTVVIHADSINLNPDLNDPAMLNHFGSLVQSFDRVLIDCQPEHHRAWALLLKGANVNGEIIVEEANELGTIAMSHFHGRDTLLVARQALSLPNRLQKRVLDLACTVPMILLLTPLFLCVAIAIKLDSKGPVFFRQTRVGRGNRLFMVLKFRSMKTESCDANGSCSTARGDSRITRVGRFIRATSIDELPQLFNVLMGDMSLVGPRPHALGSLAGNQLFWHIDETYWLRHQLKPGITGLAQVRGHRGATAEASDLINRLQSDMEYIQGWSLWRDFAILVGTFRVLIHRNAF